ncbi:hypothetical protein [Variovorax sp. PAMC26660]|uniref:hypothetical protein n=1 Tax=Variovorax sp. PAMC26660 TaxID=2762322 RepID=UPI00164D60B4|nr:hypothetical protein [Variovorax sp. PAMC26660]QNK66349.1 hypothetical protein H7F35_24585 [Variovorax sp. PAMC26660]
MNRSSFFARRLRSLAAICCLAATTHVIADEPTNAKPRTIPDVEIKATLSTAGSYGEIWSLHLTPDGLGYFRYFNNRRPQGELSGEFLFDLDAISKLAALAQTQSFEKLPKTIKPSLLMLHGPDYALSIQIGAKRHAVELFQPDDVGQTEELTRFAEVWNAIWSPLPFKPPLLPVVGKP